MYKITYSDVISRCYFAKKQNYYVIGGTYACCWWQKSHKSDVITDLNGGEGLFCTYDRRTCLWTGVIQGTGARSRLSCCARQSECTMLTRSGQTEWWRFVPHCHKYSSLIIIMACCSWVDLIYFTYLPFLFNLLFLCKRYLVKPILHSVYCFFIDFLFRICLLFLSLSVFCYIFLHTSIYNSYIHIL